jgi:hypothetical protein
MGAAWGLRGNLGWRSARAAPPGHECPGYDGTEKPAEAGSWVKSI